MIIFHVLGLQGSQRPLMTPSINPMIPSLSKGMVAQPQHKTSNFDKLIMKLQVAFPKYNRFVILLYRYVTVPTTSNYLGDIRIYLAHWCIIIFTFIFTELHVIQETGVFMYRIIRNFSKDLIMALIAKPFSSLLLCIANKTSRLDIMCPIMNLSRIANTMSC